MKKSSRALKLVSGVLLAALIGLAAGSFFRWDFPGCRSLVTREEVSPDGRLRAVQRVGSCVLTEDVYWLELKSAFWFGTEVFRHPNEFDFCWKSSTELVVQSLPAPYLMERAAKGVQVIYGGMHECLPKVANNK